MHTLCPPLWLIDPVESVKNENGGKTAGWLDRVYLCQDIYERAYPPEIMVTETG